MVKHAIRESMLFCYGGWIYYMIEILWRGHSHWTMYLLGGLCFAIIGILNEFTDKCIPLAKQALFGTIIVTVLEFATGCIVNLWLHWDVWDYSHIPLNLLGQICLPYMLLWIPLSVVAIVLDDYLRYAFFNGKKPHYCLFKHHDS